jgi:hypothetical protein
MNWSLQYDVNWNFKKEGMTVILAVRREESVKRKIIFYASIVWRLYDEIIL